MRYRDLENKCADFNNYPPDKLQFIAYCAPTDNTKRFEFIQEYFKKNELLGPLKSGEFFREYFDCEKDGWDTDSLTEDKKNWIRNFDIFIMDPGETQNVNNNVILEEMSLSNFLKSDAWDKIEKAHKRKQRSRQKS